MEDKEDIFSVLNSMRGSLAVIFISINVPSQWLRFFISKLKSGGKNASVM